MVVDTQVREAVSEVESKVAAVEAILENVRLDSRRDPEQYCEESVVPYGGE
jgi:hypothetical protein